MRKPKFEGEYQGLERDLTDLYRPFTLDHSFVTEVEQKIRVHAAQLTSPTKTKGASRWNSWITRVFSTSRALAWVALAVLLVAGLGWSIRTFLPDENRAGGAGPTDTVNQTAVPSHP